MSDKIKIAAVVGPTASGKTDVAVETALRINGEIICCDSMQIYREMNIGTAKPREEEKRGVLHHLFGFVPVCEPFSAADYTAAAREKISEISSRGHLAVLCGGTGLYLDSVLYQKDYSPAIDPSIREKLRLKDTAELYGMLCECDPVCAASVHVNNRKRVMRALEIYLGTGKTKTEWDAETRSAEPLYDARIVLLEYRDRQKLYERIDRRVDMMFDSGLEEEVKSIAFPPGATAAEAIGYKELAGYLRGEYSLECAKDMIKTATRRYAKRQMTWFRREKNALVIHPDDFSDIGDIVNIILNYLTK